MRYIWQGQEQAVGGGLPCTVRKFEVAAFSNEGNGYKAAGTISMMDYIENCPFSEKWLAEWFQEGAAVIWIVRCDDPNPFFKEEDGGAAFTAASVINDGMKKFIAERLTYVLQRVRQEPGLTEITDRAAEYTGPMEEFAGACTCPSLSRSNKAAKFDWEAATGGGKYAPNCFKCSCGQRWWCGDPNEAVWRPVADDAAWALLTKHGGVPMQPMGLVRGAVYLLPTLRERGLIALGI